MNITDIRKRAGTLAYSLTLGILITLIIACEPPGQNPTPEPMRRTAGVTISTDALSLTEGGEDGSYTVALDTRPSGEVEITISNPDTTALTVRPTMLTFTPSDYGAKTVTLSPVNDADINSESLTITHSITRSEDTAYPRTGLAIDSVAVTVTDDDPGVIISESTLSLTEGGEDGSYTVVLSTRPSGEVVITVGNTGPNADALTVPMRIPTGYADLHSETGEIGGGYVADRYSLPR